MVDEVSWCLEGGAFLLEGAASLWVPFLPATGRWAHLSSDVSNRELAPPKERSMVNLPCRENRLYIRFSVCLSCLLEVYSGTKKRGRQLGEEKKKKNIFHLPITFVSILFRETELFHLGREEAGRWEGKELKGKEKSVLLHHLVRLVLSLQLINELCRTENWNKVSE